MKNNTIWRPLKGYEGQYEVSSDGGWKNSKRNTFPRGRIVYGYRLVSLGKKKGERPLHILVAKTFPEICGEWYEGCHVHHRNFDRLDNRAENLIIITPSEHSKLHYQYQPDSFKKPTVKRIEAISKALTGRRAVDKHKPIVQLSKSGEFVKKWECISDVEKETGWSASNICWCCKGKLKTAYGFLWRYAVSS